MSSRKRQQQKWSSIFSLSKLLSNISHHILFTSKKSSRTLKKHSNKVKPTESMSRNGHHVPQSAPIIRRHVSQPVSKFAHHDLPPIVRFHTQHIAHVHKQTQLPFIDLSLHENEDYRYSMEPNLSLLNISFDEGMMDGTVVSAERKSLKREDKSIENIFHSTKIDDY